MKLVTFEQEGRMRPGVLDGEKVHVLNLVCGGTVLVLVVSRLVDTYRFYATLGLNSKVVVILRRRLHRRLMRLGLGDLQKLKTGKIVSRLSGDVGLAMGLLQQGILSPALALVRIAMTMVILLVWNWRLAVAAIAIMPPVLLLSLVWVIKVRPIFKSAGEDKNETDARMTETFSGIRVVRAFGREAKEVRDGAIGYHTEVRKRLLAFRIALFVDVFWEMLIPLTSVAIIWIGGSLFLASADRTSIGQIVAFNAYTGMLMWPMARIVFSLNQTQQSLAAMDRVFDIFDRPVDKPDPPGAIIAPAVVRDIEFDNVDFGYRSDLPVIHDFTLKVPAGAVVALVGPSGAGKTTVTDLLARFYDPTRGVIRLNGIDLSRITLQSYRRLFAVVQQDTFLFDGTVRDNINYGRRGATDKQILAAARRANALQFIEELPEGFQTVIGERGVKLSGGERQRLAIARAILADPQILMLDEATSNLDTESEQLIQAALADLYAHRTTFVVAHRLSTVTHADMIVVMQEGRIVELGTHEQLMATEGPYNEMVERQRQFAFAAQGVPAS